MTSNILDNQEQTSPTFQHRVYLGWITDLATQAEPHVEWPSLRVDEQLLRDYDESCTVIKKLGFNAVCLWGFYVSRHWPVDIELAVSPERGALIERVIETIHRHGLRVYSGLGVYSWGFEEIMRAHPHLRRTNAQAMCASEPQAWQWMQRVLDFAGERFDLDGFGLQSADQGRCNCEECSRFSDLEYHARLCARVAKHIRTRWPHHTISVSGWGMDLSDENDWPALAAMGQHIDYFTDVPNASGRTGKRRHLIEMLPCAFGTLGGPQVEPPQHWSRDRWFLPTIRQTEKHLQRLHLDGGRSCEYFFHILANPGDEISLHVAGNLLSEPQLSEPQLSEPQLSEPQSCAEEHLQNAVEQLYKTENSSTRDALCEVFLDAENAYFCHGVAPECGTISLEPLESSHVGEAIYLRSLNDVQLSAYGNDLQKLQQQVQKLAPDVPRRDKMHMIARCLQNVCDDISKIQSAAK